MPKLPALRGNEVIRVLGKVGFQVIRQKGNHVQMKHEDGREVTIPVHAGKTIGIGLLAQDTA
jgi:predicted RNA binding protein YcfA (HicA-like mRNA interferase family)